MGIKRLDAYVTDLHVLAKSLFLRKHMLIASSRLAHVYSMQLLPEKKPLSLELTYPISNPTKPFVNGGYSS
jgi:hypothetical protein